MWAFHQQGHICGNFKIQFKIPFLRVQLQLPCLEDIEEAEEAGVFKVMKAALGKLHALIITLCPFSLSNSNQEKGSSTAKDFRDALSRGSSCPKKSCSPKDDV